MYLTHCCLPQRGLPTSPELKRRQIMQFDEQKVQEFMGRMVGEFGAVASAPLIALGDRLGLYKAMSEQGWMTSTEVAERAGLAERYVREWLAAQAASGFLRYDAAAGKYQ